MSRILTLVRLCRILRNHYVNKTQCRLHLSMTNRYYATTSRLKLDLQNIVSSGFPDMTYFENVYLHDFIRENIERWPDKTALVSDIYSPKSLGPPSFFEENAV